ncbi:MAG: hypothetical protein ACR2NU_07950, partial [Aeoliella sp.]
MYVLGRTTLLAAAQSAVLLTSSAFGITLSWQGQAPPSWGNALNWTPIGIPQAGDDVQIGDLPALATDAETELHISYVTNGPVGSNGPIASLLLNRGADADTNGHVLEIDGDATLGGIAGNTTSRLVVSEHTAGPTNTALDLHNLNIEAGGTLKLEGGKAILAVPGAGGANSGDVNILPGGRFSGYGTFRFEDELSGVANTQFVNSGTLKTGRDSSASFNSRFTLAIESLDPDDTLLDLDGATESGVVNIDRMTTLAIDPLVQFFGGTLDFEPGSILELGKVWTTNSSGVINVDAESNLPGIPDTATVDGTLNLKDSAVLNVNSGTFIVGFLDTESQTTINVSGGGGLQVENSASILDAVISGDLNLLGTGISLTVNGNLDIFDDAFDWDGGEDAVTTINTGSILSIGSNDISPSAVDDSFDGTINING